MQYKEKEIYGSLYTGFVPANDEEFINFIEKSQQKGYNLSVKKYCCNLGLTYFGYIEIINPDLTIKEIQEIKEKDEKKLGIPLHVELIKDGIQISIFGINIVDRYPFKRQLFKENKVICEK